MRSLYRAGSVAFVVLAAAVALAAPPSSALSPGDLDPTFGPTGRVVTPVGSDGNGATGVVALPDGSLYVAGYADFASRDMTLLKFTPDGLFDTTFGGGDGIATADFFGHLDYADDLLVQGDGKIVLASCAATANGCDDFAVARFNPDGSLDSSFGGGDGEVTTDFDGGSDSTYGVGMTSTGKIVVAGYATIGGSPQIGVARYLPNGDPDPSFGTGGKVSIPTVPNPFAEAMAVAPDDKIVVGASGTSGGHNDMVVVRYDTDGTLDPTFGTGGVAFAGFTGAAVADGMTVFADGSVIAAGYGPGTSASSMAMARFLPDGTPDPAFGTGGRVVTDIGTTSSRADGMAVQPDGKILLFGDHRIAGQDEEMVAARYLPNGSLDAGFGTGGVSTVDFGPQSDFAYGGAVQPSGRIILAGENDNNFAMAGLVGDSGPNCTRPGGSGNDVLTGTPQADVLCGADGKDTLKGLGNLDVAVGGTGIDTASFAGATSGVVADLGTGTATSGGAIRLLEIENATGSSNADRLKGSSGPNKLAGGGGDDKLSGGASNDVLLGQGGDDTLNGGAGTDTCKQGPGQGKRTSCEH